MSGRCLLLGFVKAQSAEFSCCDFYFPCLKPYL